MVKQIFSQGNFSSTPWYRTRQGRITLGISAAILVVLIILFSEQIGNLFNLFRSHAALDTGSIGLDDTNFLNPGEYNAEVFNPTTEQWETDLNSVKVENNRLMIN